MNSTPVRERPIRHAFDESTIVSTRCVDRVLADLALDDSHAQRLIEDEKGDRMHGDHFE